MMNHSFDGLKGERKETSQPKPNGTDEEDRGVGEEGDAGEDQHDEKVERDTEDVEDR